MKSFYSILCIILLSVVSGCSYVVPSSGDDLEILTAEKSTYRSDYFTYSCISSNFTKRYTSFPDYKPEPNILIFDSTNKYFIGQHVKIGIK